MLLIKAFGERKMVGEERREREREREREIDTEKLTLSA